MFLVNLFQKRVQSWLKMKFWKDFSANVETLGTRCWIFSAIPNWMRMINMEDVEDGIINFICFCRKVCNLNEKNSNLYVKSNPKLGPLSEGLTFRYAVIWRSETFACCTPILKAYEMTFLTRPLSLKSVGALLKIILNF
jgi:hypothetical protein